MPTRDRLASFYDNPDAQSRNAARRHVEQIQQRQQREAAAHRDRNVQELAALDEGHAQESAKFGSYRPPDRVQRAQRDERIEVRQRQRQTEERIADRHERELKQAQRK